MSSARPYHQGVKKPAQLREGHNQPTFSPPLSATDSKKIVGFREAAAKSNIVHLLLGAGNNDSALLKIEDPTISPLLSKGHSHLLFNHNLSMPDNKRSLSLNDSAIKDNIVNFLLNVDRQVSVEMEWTKAGSFNRQSNSELTFINNCSEYKEASQLSIEDTVVNSVQANLRITELLLQCQEKQPLSDKACEQGFKNITQKLNLKKRKRSVAQANIKSIKLINKVSKEERTTTLHFTIRSIKQEMLATMLAEEIKHKNKLSAAFFRRDRLNYLPLCLTIKDDEHLEIILTLLQKEDPTISPIKDSILLAYDGNWIKEKAFYEGCACTHFINPNLSVNIKTLKLMNNSRDLKLRFGIKKLTEKKLADMLAENVANIRHTPTLFSLDQSSGYMEKDFVIKNGEQLENLLMLLQKEDPSVSYILIKNVLSLYNKEAVHNQEQISKMNYPGRIYTVAQCLDREQAEIAIKKMLSSVALNVRDPMTENTAISQLAEEGEEEDVEFLMEKFNGSFLEMIRGYAQDAASEVAEEILSLDEETPAMKLKVKQMMAIGYAEGGHVEKAKSILSSNLPREMLVFLLKEVVRIYAKNNNLNAMNDILQSRMAQTVAKENQVTLLPSAADGFAHVGRGDKIDEILHKTPPEQKLKVLEGIMMGFGRAGRRVNEIGSFLKSAGDPRTQDRLLVCFARYYAENGYTTEVGNILSSVSGVGKLIVLGHIVWLCKRRIRRGSRKDRTNNVI